MLKGLNLTVVVTGGIAAYKVPDFVRTLIKAGANVRVALTPSAKQFVTPFTFEVLTKYPPLVEDVQSPDTVAHITLADWTDYAIVVPATANTMAKFVNGIADNEALSMMLALDSPLLFVPAMNEKMWANPATKRNVDQLRLDGHTVVEPDTGFLAEGYEGKGRMPAPEAIFQSLLAFITINKQAKTLDLTGYRLLVSAGGTTEKLDPVRFLTNRSSGKMGLAIANVALLAGGQVTLVRTENAKNLPVLPGIEVVTVKLAQELYDKMHAHVTDKDIVIMSAAVSDYRSANPVNQKMKKDQLSNQDGLSIQLTENPDILASLPKAGHYMVGFAAETQNVIEYGRNKLVKKGVDMIVANDVSDQTIGFNADDNQVTLITKDSERTLEKQSKIGVAVEMLAHIQDNISKSKK
ncbi:bifunctional phosphopantothenoylcysteine decarboxylase/phosphopantothenate--cysteine ligase CoaBC [Aerococcus sp. HMSC10H05]|uniref:bifunctional phosphopantothenoylcysteine decarboxylase/phosphopantothenate--cysteine ligase CoaBC n=1 Tax=Aerococcus sp. HMSC10H05 TaxID=1581084 RepID=UPI0008A15BD5|nr:bifunctional phosphopantothenoylcysteine decarboxylase/phosphopantothenate--cysteine ligase CoaBC [Aerococcus sp. HMSC10H05]OFU52182.1 DNA/pantothenate metabolism flavoprotein [Aerococcus sp. HMSC10H05]